MASRRKVLRTFLTTLFVVALAAVLAILTASLVFNYQMNQQRARVLEGITPGTPFQQVDAALRQRGRQAPEEEAAALAFEARPPQGQYVYYIAELLMIRVDQKDGVVRSIEAETVEFK
jgi:hypothetical protein